LAIASREEAKVVQREEREAKKLQQQYDQQIWGMIKVMSLKLQQLV
jgi:hypothetical protein